MPRPAGVVQGPADAAAARFVTTLAACIALLLSAAVPTIFFWAETERMDAAMRSEAHVVALLVSEEVRGNPDIWMFQRTRLAGLLESGIAAVDPSSERRSVLTQDGRLIVEDRAALKGAQRTIREPFFDMGHPIGFIEINHSLALATERTVKVALAAGALGLLAFLLLRSVPLRLLRRAVDQASHLAAHDALTGLCNRARFQASLAEMLRGRRADAGAVAALMIDLDRFKPINDVYGHAAGDRVLQAVAERLLGCARQDDTVARLGGDEFGLAIDLGAHGPEGAGRLARRLVAALEAPIPLGEGTTVQVGGSVGVAIASGDLSADTLLAQADMAMYRAKAEGRNCYRFFEVGMDTKLRERAALEAELRLALQRDELEPFFQPLIELDSGRLVGFEMLARWPHATRGFIPPIEFVPIAEDAGLVGAMTERLLLRACVAARDWPAHVILAVNVSPVQLRDRQLPRMVQAALEASGLPPERLEVELTETALLADFALARLILDELKALGVRLSLDDFGTGYSSLRHLQMLPIDKIKIDASFVRAMDTDADSRKIVAAVVGLGHSLGLPTVAEGVEDHAAAAAVAELGCDIGQGFLFGKAVPIDAANALAASSAPALREAVRWSGTKALGQARPLPEHEATPPLPVFGPFLAVGPAGSAPTPQTEAA